MGIKIIEHFNHRDSFCAYRVGSVHELYFHLQHIKDNEYSLRFDVRFRDKAILRRPRPNHEISREVCRQVLHLIETKYPERVIYYDFSEFK